MICIASPSADPRFNLAAEEYLLKKTGHEFFILYRNNPSVIIGKHQNALAELNLAYVNGQDIPVIRRISGGGTVYHDPGNLNYCFIRKGVKGKMVDFLKHTRPLMDFLATLGLQAEFDGRNSLLLDGRKISGNAEHVYQDRVLHHGTILFSAELDRLSEALRVRAGLYRDKAIKSLRSLVANLGDYLGGRMDIDTFAGAFMSYIKGLYAAESADYEFTPGDIEEIDRLIDEKYSSWEWNFGYSPKYSFAKETVISGIPVSVELEVERGIIKEIRVSGEGLEEGFTVWLRNTLNGLQHNPAVLKETLTARGVVPPYFDTDALLSGLF